MKLTPSQRTAILDAAFAQYPSGAVSLSFVPELGSAEIVRLVVRSAAGSVIAVRHFGSDADVEAYVKGETAERAADYKQLRLF